MRPSPLILALILTALLGSGGELAAQQTDSTRAGVSPRPRRGARTPTDTVVRPPVSAKRAFISSLLVPGLGQAKLRRPNAGVLFAGLELVSIAMLRKSAYDLHYAKTHSRDSVIAGYQSDPNAPGGVARDSTGALIPIYAPNRYDKDLIDARRTHYEDWIFALVFNHLFSAADGFVAAQLWDLPTEVSLRASPRTESGDPVRRGVTMSASFAW